MDDEMDELRERMKQVRRRLMFDKRMGRVWAELRRPRAGARRERIYPEGAETLLLMEILNIAESLDPSQQVGPVEPGFPARGMGLVKRSDAERARKHWEKMAETLAADANYFLGVYPDDPERTKCLADAAQFYATFAAEQAEKIDFAVIDRDTGNREARFFAIALCRFFRLAFMKPGADKTIATIINVVLERKGDYEIKAAAVREWRRSAFR
jgi:hypothetical protein